MYIKSLVLKGFKSFANPTKFIFESGITAIVGVNGSGKSNISDAINWVLGEQGVKTLRGGKMQDVIFSGTSLKAQLGRAEVKIVIDNSENFLSEFGNEITILRRIFRDGASEYEINDKQVRLSDVQDILSDIGIGKEIHVVVGQGSLNQVLESKPSELRTYIEEAAGIAKHKKRKNLAFKKIDSMGGDLVRLKDIVRELKKQLKPLEKQANSAKKARVILIDEKSTKIRLLLNTFHSLKQDELKLKKEKDEAISNLDSLNHDLKIRNKQIEDEEQKIEDQFEKENNLVNLKKQLEREKVFFAGNFNLLKEKLNNVESQIVNIELKSVDKILENLNSNSATYKKISIEETTLKNNYSILKQNEQKLKEEIAILKNEFNEFLKYKNSLLEVEKKEEIAKHKNLANISLAKEKLDNFLIEKTEIIKNIRKQNEQKIIIENENLKLDDQINDLTKIINNKTIENNEINQKITKIQSEKTQTNLSITNKKIMRNQIEKQLINEKNIIKKDLPENFGFKFLIDELKINKKFEKIFNKILEKKLNSIILDRDNLLKNSEIFSSIKFEHNLNIFLKSKKETKIKELDFAKPLINYIEINDKYLDLIKTIFSKYYLLKDENLSLLEIFKLVEKYPEYYFIDSNFNIYTDNEISINVENSKTVIELKNEFTKIDTDIRTYRQNYQKLEKQEKDFSIKLDKLNKILNENIIQVDLLKEKFSTNKKEENLIEFELKMLNKKLEENSEITMIMKQSISESEESLRKLDMTKKDKNYFNVFDEENKKIKLSELNNNLQEIQIDLTKISLELEYKQNEVINLKNKIEDNQKKIEIINLENKSKIVKKEESDVYRKNILDLLDKSKKIDLILETLDDRLQKEILPLSNKKTSFSLKEKKLNVSKIENNINLENKKINSIEINEVKNQLRIEQTISEINSLDRTVLEEYNFENFKDKKIFYSETVKEILLKNNISLEQINEYESGFDKTTQETILKILKQEIKEMGIYNPLAIEEFNAINERYIFLNSQLNDVNKAKKDLLKVINDVDDVVEKLFDKTFKIVKTEFEKVFEQLFPGGRGTVNLTDPDDLLTTGLEFKIKPPNKNPSRLSLLSGGEKSLTAIAFLIAIFKSKPAPFYVLDEVEAALDNFNLQKLLKLFNQLKQTSQLIIITHQNQTMEVADTLYGVSMKENGVSKVTSQRLVIKD